MSNTIKALVLNEQRKTMQIEEVRLAEVGPGMVRVRMHAMGVCHSDLSLANGNLKQKTPAVLGHEGSGIVVEVGEGVTTVAPGEPVILNWAPSCGTCVFCLRDESHLCIHAADGNARDFAQTMNGTALAAGLGTAAFAEEALLPETAVLKIPEDIPLDLAGIIGCAVFTGVGAILHSAKVKPGESVTVVGLGGIGLCAVQGARIAGAHPIIAIDVNPEKEELAKELGADFFIVADQNTAKAVRKLTNGQGSDHVIECVGSATTIRQSWSMSRRGGKVTIVGIGRNDEKVEFSPVELFHFARTITGCVYGDSNPAHDLPRIVNFIRSGALQLEPLITHRIGLDEVDEAFVRMAAGDGARSLVVMPN